MQMIQNKEMTTGRKYLKHGKRVTSTSNSSGSHGGDLFFKAFRM